MGPTRGRVHQRRRLREREREKKRPLSLSFSHTKSFQRQATREREKGGPLSGVALAFCSWLRDREANLWKKSDTRPVRRLSFSTKKKQKQKQKPEGRLAKEGPPRTCHETRSFAVFQRQLCGEEPLRVRVWSLSLSTHSLSLSHSLSHQYGSFGAEWPRDGAVLEAEIHERGRVLRVADHVLAQAFHVEPTARVLACARDAKASLERASERASERAHARPNWGRRCRSYTHTRTHTAREVLRESGARRACVRADAVSCVSTDGEVVCVVLRRLLPHGRAREPVPNDGNRFEVNSSLDLEALCDTLERESSND